MAAFKVNITKNGNAIKFQFTDSDHYLYGNGEIEVPVNSLSLVIDESDFVTFKKASTNDTFITFNPANSNLSDKAGVIEFYKTNMVGSTGGGSESGITSGEVQTMIDASLDDYYDKDEVDSGFSTVNTAIAGKADTSAVTAVANDVSTLSGQVATKVATSDFSVYSAATDARLAEDEEVTAAALNDLDENKQDALVYYEENTEDGYADIYITNDDGQGNLDEYSLNIGGGSIDLGHYNQYDDGQGNTGYTSTQIQFSNPEINIYAESEENGETESTYFNITPLGATINNENVATEPYVDAALSGKADTSAVTAVNDALTAHTSDTGIHVSAQEKNAWNAKAEPYSAGTGIEISGNVISATGGGGATYSAGTNISIDTANTINCTLPISVTGRYLGKSLILTSGNGMAAEGACSIIAGNQVNANQNANYGCAVGSWLNIKNESESSFGVGNNSVTGSTTSGQTLFSVGNGTSSARHNAFEIRKNGDIYVNDGTNDVRLQDTILALGGLKFVSLSQAEYDALVSGGTVDSSTIYFITNVVS